MITMRNGTKYYRENELSKLGYIKKEELKDKIIILFKKRLDDKVINDENFLGFNDFKCDILELLESEDK